MNLVMIAKERPQSVQGGHASEKNTNRLGKAEPAAKTGKGWALAQPAAYEPREKRQLCRHFFSSSLSCASIIYTHQTRVYVYAAVILKPR